MPSSSFSRISAVIVAATAFCVVNVTEALPSFGTKIPNGEVVPCPPSLLEDDSSGCTANDYCLGLGHPNCGGFQSEDKIEGNPTTILLNPFGEDWRSNGFVWTKELCELDSDQDGYTNGEELGDPCCVWTTASSQVMLNSVDGFLPSHPGMIDHTQPVGSIFNKTSLCTNIEDESIEDDTKNEDYYDKYYNPEETRGSFELRIDPFPIPIKETTYANFIFNIPEDLPDFFHVVFGEAIIDQPDHLHHFVINGCPSRIDPSLEGTVMQEGADQIFSNDCSMVMIGQWAPGSDLFGNDSLETGVMLGRGMGIEAFQLQIHYTDGVYENPETLTPKMATDGVRIHFTTDFRPFTSARKQLISVPYGPPELNVPPNESRYFLSRTCKVDTSCKDIDDELFKDITRLMGEANTGDGIGINSNMMNDLTCASIKMFCSMGGKFGPIIQTMCPVTCGFCGDGTDSEKNPLNPESYRVTSVSYHAHLLGREMYTTLLREVDDEADLLEQVQPENIAISQKQVSAISARPKKMVAKDMKSREAWYFDDQANINLDYDIVVTDPTDAATTSMIRGMEVKPGDKIQVTCVYDSIGRSEATRFGFSTYDEMCLTAVFITFKTPKSILELTEGGEGDTAFAATVANAYVGMMLHLFACENDYKNHTTDVYQGFLTEAEDARNIWFEHPIEESNMCTIADMTGELRNCPIEDIDEMGPVQDYDGMMEDFCLVLSSSDDVEFLENSIAGYTCIGGTYDQKDSNEAPLYVTENDCLEVGGGLQYTAYSCADVEYWILYEAQDEADMTSEIVEDLRTEWWQPKCCRHQSDDNDIGDGEPSDEDEPERTSLDNNGDDNSLSSTAVRSACTYGCILAFITSSTILAMIA